MMKSIQMKSTALTFILLLINIMAKGQDTIRKYHHKDTLVLAREYVVNDSGKADGFFRVYFEDGKLRGECMYNDGRLWNITVLRDADGNDIKDKGTLRNGTGTVMNYNEKGVLTSVRTYKDGVLHGESTKYYGNGNILMTGSFYEGHRCGKWLRYDQTGKLKENGEKVFGINCKNGLPIN